MNSYLCIVNATKQFIALLFILLFVIVFGDDLAAQCSMCKKVASDGTAKREVGNTINYAILYLMSIPYFALAFIFRKQIGSLIRQFRSK